MLRLINNESKHTQIILIIDEPFKMFRRKYTKGTYDTKGTYANEYQET